MSILPPENDETWDEVERDLPELTQTQLDELYTERAQLIAHLSVLYPSRMLIPKFSEDWPVIYIDLPRAGQISWHIAKANMDLFGHVSTWQEGEPGAPVWDGHDTAEKYRRLYLLTALIHTENWMVAFKEGLS